MRRSPSLSALKAVVNIVVLLVIIVAVYCFFQNHLANRRQRLLRACIVNMQLIEDAKGEFQQDRGLPDGRGLLATQLTPYLDRSCDFRCPAKGVEYEIGKLGELPVCPIHGSLEEPHLPGKGR